MVNYEVKGQLAKLLATEDLVIENRQVSTASFDVDKRVLTLPLWERALTSYTTFWWDMRLDTHCSHLMKIGP